MSASITHAEALLGATFPSTGVDTHWVTNNRTVWNEQERVSEERELVYEISWIPELGAWRSFLRLRAKGEQNSVGSHEEIPPGMGCKSTNAFKDERVRKRIEPVVALRMPFPETTNRRFLL